MVRDHVDKILDDWALERPDLDVSAQGIVGRVLRLAKFYERQLADAFHPFGLSGGDFDVLATLRRCGLAEGLPASSLAQRCMLSAAAMTSRIDRLETMAYVQRVADRADRRVVRIILTGNGSDLIDQVIMAHVKNQEAIVSVLSAKERRQLTALLRTAILPFERDRGVD